MKFFKKLMIQIGTPSYIFMTLFILAFNQIFSLFQLRTDPHLFSRRFNLNTALIQKLMPDGGQHIMMNHFGLSAEAQKHNITVSDKEIYDYIEKKIPLFQKDEKFNQELYNSIQKECNATPEDIYRYVQAVLISQRFKDLILCKDIYLINKDIEKLTELTGKFYPIDLNQILVPLATEKQLQLTELEAISEKRNLFWQPELRSGKVYVIDDQQKLDANDHYLLLDAVSFEPQKIKELLKNYQLFQYTDVNGFLGGNEYLLFKGTGLHVNHNNKLALVIVEDIKIAHYKAPENHQQILENLYSQNYKNRLAKQLATKISYELNNNIINIADAKQYFTSDISDITLNKLNHGIPDTNSKITNHYYANLLSLSPGRATFFSDYLTRPGVFICDTVNKTVEKKLELNSKTVSSSLLQQIITTYIINENEAKILDLQ